jgi:ABC-type nitrate/sulfonate/bicarbonate transport system ATPase subunit
VFPLVEFKNITKNFGERTVLENFSLTVKKGSKIALMGESGVGKTTLLRIAAGLEKPDGGEFVSDERIAVMFQEPRLLPWKTALENVRAVLKKEHFSLADKYLSAVGLENDRNKYPHTLSGGMAQRVAFARFLAFAEYSGAALLLLDEPFSALDGETGKKMLELLKDFSEGKTVLLVTHDKADADKFADEIVRL